MIACVAICHNEIDSRIYAQRYPASTRRTLFPVGPGLSIGVILGEHEQSPHRHAGCTSKERESKKAERVERNELSEELVDGMNSARYIARSTTLLSFATYIYKRTILCRYTILIEEL